MPRILACILITLAAVSALTAQESVLKFIEGRTFLKGEFSAGEKSVSVHVLLDLASAEPLKLHARTAQLLELSEGDSVRFLTRGHELFSAVPVLEEIKPLERLTRDLARELEEVPVVAIVGAAAFGTQVIDLDPRQRTLRLSAGPSAALPTAAAIAEGSAPQLGERVEIPFGSGSLPRFPVRLVRGENTVTGFACLDTANYHLRVDAAWLQRAGKAGDAATALMFGPWDLIRCTAQRISDEAPAADGTPLLLGNAFLESFRIRLDMGRRVVQLECIEPLPDRSAAIEAFRAMRAGDLPALARWLEANAEHELRLEVATAHCEGLLRGRPLPEAAVLMAALRAKSASERPARKSRELLEMLARWKEQQPEIHALLFRPVLELAVECAGEDEDGTAVHKARSEIGALLLDEGDLEGAWRQLLAASLGMPRDGTLNERLGRLYERMGKRERAFSRFLQAAITVEGGPGGLAGLGRLRRAEGGAPFNVNELERMLEGRAPIFEPASVHRPAAPSSRRVLVELFTGAHCKPCAAADLAFEGLTHHFAGGEATCIQHHLHVPKPDPLTHHAALVRAEALAVAGTPTLLLDGRIAVPMGGPQADAGKRFREAVAAIEKRLSEPTPWRLDISATLEARALKTHVTVSGPADASAKLRLFVCERSMIMPGASGIVFHRVVSRAEMEADGVAIKTGAVPFQRSFLVRLADIDAANASHQDEVEDASGAPFPLRAGPLDPGEIIVVAFLEAEDTVVQSARFELAPREVPAERQR